MFLKSLRSISHDFTPLFFFQMLNCVIIAQDEYYYNKLFHIYGGIFIEKYQMGIRFILDCRNRYPCVQLVSLSRMRSIPGAILAIIALILVMGYGFKTKKKMREQGHYKHISFYDKGLSS